MILLDSADQFECFYHLGLFCCFKSHRVKYISYLFEEICWRCLFLSMGLSSNPGHQSGLIQGIRQHFENKVERILLDFPFLSNIFLEAYKSTMRMNVLKLVMDR